jgi:hypothetical protein
VTVITPGASQRAQSVSKAMRLKWQDPEYRAKRAVCSERRRNDPTKTRRGIPNGYTREEADKMWAECHASATADVKAIEAQDSEPWHPYAREALIHTLAVMRSACNQRIKLRAARLFLEFTRPKPKGHPEVSMETAEEWIEAVMARG